MAPDLHLRDRRRRLRGQGRAGCRRRQGRAGGRRPTPIQQLLEAGLVDELNVDVMPVLLGSGQRFLGGFEASLERIGVREFGVRTNLRFRVKR